MEMIKYKNTDTCYKDELHDQHDFVKEINNNSNLINCLKHQIPETLFITQIPKLALRF